MSRRARAAASNGARSACCEDSARACASVSVAPEAARARMASVIHGHRCFGACSRPLLEVCRCRMMSGRVGANRSPWANAPGASRNTPHLSRPYKLPRGEVMLKLGYKASAEQFAPRELLEFAVHAEEVGFDSVVVSDHFQPWRHTDGHAPFSFAWLAALGERTTRAIIGTSVVTPTFRYHPAIVAQAMGDARRALSGARVPGRRHRRIAERGAGDRHRVAGVQGALRPAARGDRADAAPRARGARDLRGRVLPDRARHDLRPPRGRRCRSTSPPPARPRPSSPAASPTASSAPAARRGSSTPRRCCRRSPRGWRRPAAIPAASSA